MKEQKTIYAVVRLSPNPTPMGLIVYTKQSSNREKMLEYKEEIAKKCPNCKVVLMSREKAKSEQLRYNKWYKEWEEKTWDEAYKKMIGNGNKENTRSYYSNSGCIKNGSISTAMSRTW